MSLNSYIYSVARAGLCVFARTAYVNRMGSIKKQQTNIKYPTRGNFVKNKFRVSLIHDSAHQRSPPPLSQRCNYRLLKFLAFSSKSIESKVASVLAKYADPAHEHALENSADAGSFKALSIFCRFVAFLMELTFPSVLLACRTMIYWPDLRGMLHCHLPTARRRREK